MRTSDIGVLEKSYHALSISTVFYSSRNYRGKQQKHCKMVFSQTHHSVRRNLPEKKSVYLRKKMKIETVYWM